MKSLNKTVILVITAFFSTIAIGGVYIYFFVSMQNKTQDAIGLSAKIEEISGSESRYRAAASALQTESAQIAKLSSYYISADGVVAFAQKLESLGPQAGVTLSLKSLDPGTTSSGAPVLSLELTAEGTFVNEERLLTLLQNFPGNFVWKTVKLARVDNIALATSGTTARSAAPQWNLDVSLDALNFVKQ